MKHWIEFTHNKSHRSRDFTGVGKILPNPRSVGKRGAGSQKQSRAI